jgi:anti-sigma factor RsiW
MNHPEREEWVPYLFGEAKPEDRRRLKNHLAHCAECRAELENWQQSLKRLDAWRLPRSRPIREAAAPLFRWAAAAALVLILGFGVGRLTAPKVDAERMRVQLREELTQLVRQEVSRSAEQTLEAANRQTEAAVAESAQVLYATVKHDLDTLAVNADLGLRRAEQQLVLLAGNAQPAGLQNPSDHN